MHNPRGFQAYRYFVERYWWELKGGKAFIQNQSDKFSSRFHFDATEQRLEQIT